MHTTIGWVPRPVVYPWPENMKQFLTDLWTRQGKTNQSNCSGMSSFSFWPERVTYDASDDSLVDPRMWQL